MLLSTIDRKKKQKRNETKEGVVYCIIRQSSRIAHHSSMAKLAITIALIWLPVDV